MLAFVTPQVPSSTKMLALMFLDMVGENTRGFSLPDTDMFRNDADMLAFHDAIEDYVLGMTTRCCANVLTPEGGGAGNNNATECLNKLSHDEMPVRKHPTAHVTQMLSHLHQCSRNDQVFGDAFRRDTWHHDLWLAVKYLMTYIAFAANKACLPINIYRLALTKVLSIDSVSPADMVHNPHDGTPREFNIASMRKEPRTCKMVPTYITLQHLVRHHPGLFDATHGEKEGNGVETRIKNFLDAPCVHPALGPSWADQAAALFNEPAAEALATMNLSEWLSITNSFAVLVPLTDADDKVRYLKRFERGIPIEDLASTRSGNGCIVQWDLVPRTSIFYCLCPDHSLRGVCLHVVMMLVSEGLIKPPPKWSCDRVHGPSKLGRSSAFVKGTALLVPRQPSKHAGAKVRKALERPGGQNVNALVSCMGTIKLESDSVRKYTEGKHTGGGFKSKDKADAVKRTPKKPRKSRAKKVAHALSLTLSCSVSVSPYSSLVDALSVDVRLSVRSPRRLRPSASAQPATPPATTKPVPALLTQSLGRKGRSPSQSKTPAATCPAAARPAQVPVPVPARRP